MPVSMSTTCNYRLREVVCIRKQNAISELASIVIIIITIFVLENGHGRNTYGCSGGGAVQGQTSREFVITTSAEGFRATDKIIFSAKFRTWCARKMYVPNNIFCGIMEQTRMSNSQHASQIDVMIFKAQQEHKKEMKSNLLSSLD